MTTSSQQILPDSSSNVIYKNREDWLLAAVEKLKPYFKLNKYEIPPVKVGVGFASKSPLKTLGQCWSDECTSDHTTHIFISPVHKTSVEVLSTLVHELLHSVLPIEAKHGPDFKAGMKLLGLEGKARSASAGPALLEKLEVMAEELGDFPNSPLKPTEKIAKNRKKSSFKLHCPLQRKGDRGCSLPTLSDEGEGKDEYIVSCNRKSLKIAFPICPGCAKEMEMEADDYELYKLSE